MGRKHKHAIFAGFFTRLIFDISKKVRFLLVIVVFLSCHRLISIDAIICDSIGEALDYFI